MPKRRWILEALGVLLLAAVVWSLGPLVGWNETHPLVDAGPRRLLCGALIGLWLLTVLTRLGMHRVKAKRANRRMMAELAHNEELLSLASVRADEEVTELSERFRQAMDLLHRRMPGRKGSLFVYEMPWYVVIGPPGSGKTTMLRNSGLHFPLAAELGLDGVAGVGGTRNCDWWFTEEAVLLDTAGRYTTHESDETLDRAAWLGFLDLIKRHRPRRPVNGVVVTLSLAEMLSSSPEQRAFHARTIRARIQELSQQFGIRIPVYVVFTKGDMVAGFSEYFDDLPQEEREQVWGTTFPVKGEGPGSGLLVDSRDSFDGLVRRLGAALLRRLDEERDLARRGLVYSFPGTFALLKEPILDMLGEIMRPSRFETAPTLRGFYFSSATQEGTPIDAAAALDGGLGLKRAISALGAEPRSFFITRLLRDVVFREAELAGVDRRVERRLQVGQWGGLAAAGAAIAAMTGLWSLSYMHNTGTIGDVQQNLSEFRRLLPPPSDRAAGSLVPALDAIEHAEAVYDDDRVLPFLEGFGLYRGFNIDAAVEDARLRTLHGELLPRITDRAAARVTQAPNLDELKKALEVYLMLGSPERMETPRLREWVTADWRRTYALDPARATTLESNLDAMLAAGPLPAQTLDAGLIARARGVLNRISVPEQIYDQLKAEASAVGLAPFNATSLLGAAGQQVFWPRRAAAGDLTIPGFYTRDGFYRFFLPRMPSLMALLSENDWVLGVGTKVTSQQAQEVSRRVAKLYADDYVAHWDRLANALDVASFDQLAPATEILSVAAGANSPVAALLQAIAINTNLAPPVATDSTLGKLAGAALGTLTGSPAQAAQTGGPGLLGTPVSRGGQSASTSAATSDPAAGFGDGWPGTPIQQHFARLNALTDAPVGGTPPVNGLIANIGAVYGQLVQIQTANDPGGVALQIAGKRGGGAGTLSGMPGAPPGVGMPLPMTLAASATGPLPAGAGFGPDPIATLRQSAALQPMPLRRWLEEIGNASWGVVLNTAALEAGTLYQQQVLPSCETALAGRYPFDRSSRNEATVQDFGQFFKPAGTADAFFGGVLAPFVNTQAKSWAPARVNGQALPFGPGLSTFQRSALIRDIFFRSGQGTPAVEFTLVPVYMDATVLEFQLDYGATSLAYRHGPPRSQKLVWPSTEGGDTVKISFKGVNGQQATAQTQGQWAWFRMLDTQKVAQTGVPNRFRVTFEAGGMKVTYELTASSAVNPFFLDALNGFTCPAAL